VIGPSGTVRVMVATKPVDFRKGRKRSKQGGHDENAAIAILNVSRMNDGVEQQA
jgi:hypothetical protein